MKRSIKLSLGFFLATAVGACSTTPPVPHLQNSGNVYRASEAQRAMHVQACTVTSARYVAVIADGREDRQRDLATSGVGIVAGGLIGRAIGNEIGSGSGQSLARDLGTVVGAGVGAGAARNANARRNTRTGVEYQVAMGNGQRRAVVQNLNPGEAALPAGTRCQIVGNSRSARIIPM